MATRRSALLVVALMSCVLIQSADALIHVVGGGCGWEVPPNRTFYADWAKPRTFGVGDKLAEYYKGPFIFQLNNTGDYYFYSNVGTHCEMGQKLHITVGTAPGSSGFVFVPPRRLLSLPAPAKHEPEAPAPSPDVIAAASAATNNVGQFLGLGASCLVAMLLM
ncbi:hypothetical protein Cgig2_026971 [Carnegiea gigantea]|uniref:Phytocyanin domain-containing protein n=1 Tax=Carnegiea gigantea TaxID=171969 RepID=A0A9Q1KX15_9CARY|nr:hypothetical protein Cgig2_026971 [Carnegiea gigantea]